MTDMPKHIWAFIGYRPDIHGWEEHHYSDNKSDVEYIRADCVNGPGSPGGRFGYLMDELEKRLPDPSPFSGAPPEERYLAALDTLLAKHARIMQFIDQQCCRPPNDTE